MSDIIFYCSFVGTCIAVAGLYQVSNGYRKALVNISKNSCCDQCQQAKKVAEQALGILTKYNSGEET